MVRAFQYSYKLESVQLPDNSMVIGNNSFDGCINLLNINMPTNVTKVGYAAFLNTKLEDITIYGYIEARAFSNCSNLKTIIIQESVDNILDSVFINCITLQIVEFKSTTPPTIWNSNLFDGCPNTFKIYVPDSAVDTYKAVTQLSAFVDRILPVSQKP